MDPFFVPNFSNTRSVKTYNSWNWDVTLYQSVTLVLSCIVSVELILGVWRNTDHHCKTLRMLCEKIRIGWLLELLTKNEDVNNDDNSADENNDENNDE